MHVGDRTLTDVETAYLNSVMSYLWNQPQSQRELVVPWDEAVKLGVSLRKCEPGYPVLLTGAGAVTWVVLEGLTDAEVACVESCGVGA